MVSDSELVGRLREFLSTSDLTTTTTASVRRKLEQDFGIDLTDKQAFIREQVDLYLESQQQNDEGNEEEEEPEAYEEEAEEEEEESEDASNGKSGGSKKRRSKKPNKEVKKRGGGFTKLCSLSPQLQKFIGVAELARTEVVKQLWSYIREHDLQDPTNRRNIRCDGPFRELFGVDSIDMFQMNKALAKHIWPLDFDAPVSSAPMEKQRKEREEDPDEPKRKEKRQKGAGGSGILAPIPLSEALVKFLGTGENALARSDVVKRIWDYIKQNNLQASLETITGVTMGGLYMLGNELKGVIGQNGRDPSDKRRILCNDKLKELFGVDTFNGFTVSKLLATHFIKAER